MKGDSRLVVRNNLVRLFVQIYYDRKFTSEYRDRMMGFDGNEFT